MPYLSFDRASELEIAWNDLVCAASGIDHRKESDMKSHKDAARNTRDKLNNL